MMRSTQTEDLRQALHVGLAPRSLRAGDAADQRPGSRWPGGDIAAIPPCATSGGTRWRGARARTPARYCIARRYPGADAGPG